MKYILTLFTFACLTLTSFGQYYGGYGYGCNYCNPCYYNNYGHNYYQRDYYAQKVVAQEIAVAPLIVTVPVDTAALPIQAYNPLSYYSVGNAYGQKTQLREIIREELRNALGADLGSGQAFRQQPSYGGYSQPQQGYGGYQQQAQQMPAPSAPRRQQRPPQQAPPPPAQPQSQQGRGPATEIENGFAAEDQAKIVAVLQNNRCTNCHGGGATLGGDFRLVFPSPEGYSLVHLPKSKWQDVFYQMAIGKMPKDAQKDPNKRANAQDMGVIAAVVEAVQD